MENSRDKKTYSYKTRKEKIRIKLIDGMDSICKSKGAEAENRAKYYDSYDFGATNPDGSYTGVTDSVFDPEPVQDADDL